MDNFCKYREVYSAQQINSIAEEFGRISGQYYLEHAGATLYSEKQIREISHQLVENLYGNPHARNISSKATEDAVDIVRYQILTHFNTTPEEYSVIFTSGATAALKLVAENFTYNSGRFAFLQDNHTSVLGMRAYADTVNCVRVDDAFNALSKNLYTVAQKSDTANSLFVYPAQSNFAGTKYPLEWIERVKNGGLNGLLDFKTNPKWFVALDAASYVSTTQLDLKLFQPDFVCVSFYKIFGYPTGLGALLVRNSSSHVLGKAYYGGGTVQIAHTLENSVVIRDVIHERYEDGTVPFLAILSLREGFNTIQRLNISFDLISQHTFRLAQYVYRNLLCLHHSNGKPAVILYHSTTFEDHHHQGGIVNFNVLRDNGDYVGFAEVSHFANLYGIHLRTGCFCNPGACQHFLKLKSEDIMKHFREGHVCGDQKDLIDGQPTGSVRISFGYMSTKTDADKLIEMIEECFVGKPALRKFPPDYKMWRNKYENYFILREPHNNSNREIDKCYNHLLSNHFTEPEKHIDGVLKQIIVYPIKSCGGFQVLDKWPITDLGLKYDRQWMIVNAAGVCLTQKNNKRMCLIRPIIELETQTLILCFPDHKRIYIPISSTRDHKLASMCQSKVCEDKIQASDCGNDVAVWLSNVLNTPGIRLLRHFSETENFTRISKHNEQLQLSLANKAQYLLINATSVEWLREQIPEDELNENQNVTIQRFRPNFVVDFSVPFIENDCKKFIFNGTVFEAGGVCTRCQMICIDQTTGNTSKEPLRTLSKTFRGKIEFGMYLNKTGNAMEEWLHLGCTINGVVDN